MSRRSINLEESAAKPTRRRRVVLREWRYVITGKKRGKISVRVTDSFNATDEEESRKQFQKSWEKYDIEEVKKYPKLIGT